MKVFQTLVFLLVALNTVSSQTNSEPITFPNLVPNPGFEVFAAPPIGWFYKGRHFTEVMKYWSSPTAASPDAFGPRVRVPRDWAEKGFGDQKPRSGASMAGITVFGCEEGKPHCREYIQIQLSESLVAGQEYKVSFWVSRLAKALQVNNIGAYFSVPKTARPTDEQLLFQPQINSSKIIEPATLWTEITGQFVANTGYNYLTIGNFFPDSLTQTKVPCKEHFNYSYYYIDDVSVRKVEPIIPVPLPEDDLSKLEVEAGKVVRLKNIFFETDEAELLPRSFIELNKLLHLMRDHPGMVIQVQGHTDIRGTEAYNQGLSERRAKAVVDFLTANEISTDRTGFEGFGSRKPIAGNDTEEGRQLNRRVEFVIVHR